LRRGFDPNQGWLRPGFSFFPETDYASERPVTVQEQIDNYIAAQPEPKRSEMRELHGIILAMIPGCRLWFLDGKDAQGRTVSNPNIGYGTQTTQYADGKTREFYQIGISANTTGISVYLMGLDDKTYLAREYGTKIGQASVTGYCIKFRKLGNVDIGVLVDAMRYGVGRTRCAP
jgi:hypothetical protein